MNKELLRLIDELEDAAAEGANECAGQREFDALLSARLALRAAIAQSVQPAALEDET